MSNPMEGDASRIIPKGEAEEHPAPGRSSFPWVFCIIIGLYVVIGAAVGIFFGVVELGCSDDGPTDFELLWNF